MKQKKEAAISQWL